MNSDQRKVVKMKVKYLALVVGDTNIIKAGSLFKLFLGYFKKKFPEGNIELLIHATIDQMNDDGEEWVEAGLRFLHCLSISFPLQFVDHLILIESYMKESDTCGDMNRKNRLQIVVLSILAQIIPASEAIDLDFLSALEKDLMVMLGKGSQRILEHALPCFIQVTIRSKSTYRLKKVSEHCLSVIKNFKDGLASDLDSNTLRNIFRCLIISSLIDRYSNESLEKSMV